MLAVVNKADNFYIYYPRSPLYTKVKVSVYSDSISDNMELLTKCPQKMCNGNMGRKNDAHWRHFMAHINRFRFKAVAERRQ